ncbi:MAG: hypothetical protein C4298_07360 [Thermus sp.]|uniref:hypothetical protein n=1 Tax=Thermus sp. TaxID=275 RepID=UPI0033190761
MRAAYGWLGFLALVLSGCQNFFQGGIVFGGPTILAERRNFSSGYDSTTNTYTYAYTLSVYTLPGSGAGTVVFLDSSENPLDSLLIPQSCPPEARDPCGPYSKEVRLESRGVSLWPKEAVKYRSISANGQSKILPLENPLQLY